LDALIDAGHDERVRTQGGRGDAGQPATDIGGGRLGLDDGTTNTNAVAVAVRPITLILFTRSSCDRVPPQWMVDHSTVAPAVPLQGEQRNPPDSQGLNVQPLELRAQRPGAMEVDTTSTVAVRANPVVSVAVTTNVKVPARRSTPGYA
jgi:hypothetical protein